MREFEGRARALQLLSEYLHEQGCQRAEGFPDATSESIQRASDPPFYTACPNPFLASFIRSYAKPYERRTVFQTKPYTGWLTSSSRHPVYAFHPYHTKVPPEVVRALIEHYTEPGDVVLDGFCGSGMTGVAAREAGRHAVLCDLSPVAAFISGVNCQAHDWQEALKQLTAIIAASEALLGHLYLTLEGGEPLTVNYCIWSDVFACPDCRAEFPFFPHAVVHHGHKVETRKSFYCPHCRARLSVRRVERVLTGEGKKSRLVWVSAGQGKKRIKREPTAHDLCLALEAEAMPLAVWSPSDIINPDGYTARLAQLGDKAITDVSRLLSRRNLHVYADLWQRVSEIAEAPLRHLCRATLTGIFTTISERQGYFGGGGGMSGNLYMPIVRMEKNIYATLRRKLRRLEEAERAKESLTARAIVSTQSATSLAEIPEATIDYIYTDPPFGANIIYSEMNLVLEAWLRVRTDAVPEAVIDHTRGRGPGEYQTLMRRCFDEYFRVLKPGRWLTVEFHNTSAEVWNLLQTVIGESGFRLAEVGVFDKGSTTILADIRPGAAKHDLVISAYKPLKAEGTGFRLRSACAEGVWGFVAKHLETLPVTASGEGGRAEKVPERTCHLLFDAMLAHHLRHRLSVPLSAAEFYAGLKKRFAERERMYFLPAQLALYEREQRRRAARK